ncbi:MAG: response regulator transcription factor [Clostridiaceae bacterium]|nr:response regulator transcription factor [Clostridiaceae bacterium]
MIKILFMEDEPTIQDVTSEYLKMNNYEVVCVQAEDEAIDMLKKDKFDLAILDIMVPNGSGFNVLEYIKKTEVNMATIMLTALGDETTQLKAFNLYADDYIIKPFSPLLLIKRVEAVLRRTLANKIEPIQKDGLLIKEDSYEVYFDNKSLGLTLSEFLLFDTLYNNPNKVFSRENLILKIFDEEYCGNDRIIDAHVKNLRKKLPKNYIKTVIGVGYQYNKEID